jgi:hypothetical protein
MVARNVPKTIAGVGSKQGRAPKVALCSLALELPHCHVSFQTEPRKKTTVGERCLTHCCNPTGRRGERAASLCVRSVRARLAAVWQAVRPPFGKQCVHRLALVCSKSVRACVCVRVRACVRVCACACARVAFCFRVFGLLLPSFLPESFVFTSRSCGSQPSAPYHLRTASVGPRADWGERVAPTVGLLLCDVCATCM